MFVSLRKCLAWKVTELSERLERLVTVESDPPWCCRQKVKVLINNAGKVGLAWGESEYIRGM